MLNKLLSIATSVWLIFSAAFLMRTAFVWHQQRIIPHEVLASVPFENEAGNIADALAQGRGFSDVFRKPTGPTAWLAPVYPSLLAAIFRIFGQFTYSSFLAAALLNCVFSSAATIPLYFAARRVSGVRLAALAAWLWALCPSGIILPFEWIWDTSLSAFLACAILWITFELASSADCIDWIAYAVLWAISLLTNPALGILLPFFLLWLVFRNTSENTNACRLPALVCVATIILCCAPWTIRNYFHFHRLIPLRSNLPFELWIGNNDIFDEHAVGGTERITRFGEVRLYAQLGENAYMEEKRHLAWDFIRTHPLLEARLTFRRITAAWLGTEHPLHDFLSTDSLLIRSIFLFSTGLTLATIVGVALLFLRRNPFAIPLSLVPLLFPLVYYATHSSLRYRHPIEPILLLISAFTILSALHPRAILAGPRDLAS
ncbi:MAG TPA: glycosyltransferase family 39 protein [Candidatus Acidoferrum sp.]|nr:glycosyltransferase family 39 protein [Candidatus Acidoferrum sp.]